MPPTGRVRLLAVTLAVASVPYLATGLQTPENDKEQEQDDEGYFEEVEARFEWNAVVDFRLARTGETTTWLDRGLGKARFGSGNDDEGRWLVRVAQTSLELTNRFGDSLHSHLHFNADLEPDNRTGETVGARVGLVEGFLVWRLELPAQSVLHTKIGRFFPPISMEHPGPAWTTELSITPSAINSWIGEEVRTTGVEFRWAKTGLSQEAGLLGAALLYNDPTASLLAYRGWALHDRQTATGDKLPLAPIRSIQPGGLFENQSDVVRPFEELDDEIGYYVGGFWENFEWFRLNGLFFDNRGIPATFNGYQYAWRTRFVNLGTNIFLGESTEILGQVMHGDSEMGIDTARVRFDFDSAYVLATRQLGAHRLSLRYDWFRTVDNDRFVAQDNNNEDGSAWTLAYLVELSARARLATEWMRVHSTRRARETIGTPSESTDYLLQISLRLTI